jgi:predicted membrane protein
MALDDPVVLLAILALFLLISYQLYKRGKRRKQNALEKIGSVILIFGIFLFILFDFLTAFVFVFSGLLLIMIGEFVSRFTS